jgi:hypothetical protein
MDLCRDTLPAASYFSNINVNSNQPGAMPTLAVGMWEVQAFYDHGTRKRSHGTRMRGHGARPELGDEAGVFCSQKRIY